MGLNCFGSAMPPCEGADVSGRGGAVTILKDVPAGERILSFDSVAAGGSGGMLKGFTGVSMDGYGSLGAGISARRRIGIST